jgi:hypothetical protein
VLALLARRAEAPPGNPILDWRRATCRASSRDYAPLLRLLQELAQDVAVKSLESRLPLDGVSRHGHERQQLVGNEHAASPVIVKPADRAVDVALLDRVQRYARHARHEGSALTPLVGMELDYEEVLR